MKPPVSHLLSVWRQDAARWIEPGRVHDASEVTPPVLAKLAFRHLSLRATMWLRVGSFLKARGWRGVVTFIQHRLHRLYGLEIAPGSVIGPGLYIAHPVGCTISAERIGRNVTIIGSVTIGYNKSSKWPVVGDNVYIGTGARVLGPIVVGDYARIAANAVVLEDVETNCTVAGIPAQVVRKGVESSEAGT